VSTVDPSLRHRQLKAHHDSHGLMGPPQSPVDHPRTHTPTRSLRATIKG
jgi:hypothetical protein